MPYEKFITYLYEPLITATGRRVSQAETKRIVEAINRTIIRQVRDNGFRLSIPSIGIYYPRTTKSRSVRNPVQQSTKCQTAPQKKVSFRPGVAARKKL